MNEIRRTATAEEGRLVLEDAAFHAGESFEVVVLTTGPQKTGTVGDFLDAAFGLWADRGDIGDSVEYARKLRGHVEANPRGMTIPFFP